MNNFARSKIITKKRRQAVFLQCIHVSFVCVFVKELNFHRYEWERRSAIRAMLC